MLAFVGKYKNLEHLYLSIKNVKQMCLSLTDILPLYDIEFTWKIEEHMKENDYTDNIFISLEGYEFSAAGEEKVRKDLSAWVNNNTKTLVLSPSSHNHIGYNRSKEEIESDFNKISRILFDNDHAEAFSQLSRTAHLPLICNSFLNDKKDLKVLDYGGGMGLHYLALSISKSADANIEYKVIERPGECIDSTEFWKKFDKHKISFTRQIPIDEKFDVVYARASLPYMATFPHIDNYNAWRDEGIVSVQSWVPASENQTWQTEAQKLIDTGAEYLILTEFVSSIKEETHLTTQRWRCEYLTPYRVYNREELERFFKERGYEIIHSTHKESGHAFQINWNDHSKDRFMSDYIFKKEQN